MSTENAVALFKGANLPSVDLNKFKHALSNAQAAAAVQGNTPFLRMLKQDGSWVYGANETDVQEGSLWAVNPLSLEIGFIAWNPKGGAPLGKRMVSIFQSPLNKADMPDVGADWDENVKFSLKCLNGEDAGTEVEYTANSYGGRKAFGDLLAALQKQLDMDPEHVVPVVELKNTSYEKKPYGTIYNPVFEIKRWTSMAGDNAAPQEKVTAAAATAQAEQPVQVTPQPAAQAEPVQRPRRRTRAPVA